MTIFAGFGSSISIESTPFCRRISASYLSATTSSERFSLLNMSSTRIRNSASDKAMAVIIEGFGQVNDESIRTHQKADGDSIGHGKRKGYRRISLVTPGLARLPRGTA